MARSRRSSGGFGEPFLVPVGGREVVHACPLQVSSVLKSPLAPALIVVDLSELSRVVDGHEGGSGGRISGCRTRVQPVAGSYKYQR